jgi:hypothetical protein
VNDLAGVILLGYRCQKAGPVLILIRLRIDPQMNFLIHVKFLHIPEVLAPVFLACVRFGVALRDYAAINALLADLNPAPAPFLA